MPIDFPVSFLVSQKEGHSWTVRFDTEGHYSVGLSAENEVALDAEGIFDRHLSLDITQDCIFVRPASPGAEFTFNGRYANICTLRPGDEIGLPGYTLTRLADEEEFQDSPGHLVELSYIVSKPGPLSDASRAFPGAWFLAAGTVSIPDLTASGGHVTEAEFASIGGGLGSFAWIDHLRISGVPAASIRVVGIDPVCYGNYKRYCENSQIPGHERLRSNSQSTPDNIWGFPGYASREALSELARGRLGGLRHVLQVFGEPALAASFTPRAGRVYASLDREMSRIGWNEMFVRGRALGIRKTDDGRYAIALRHLSAEAPEARNGYLVARHIHLATGYPTTRFVNDFRSYIAKYPEDRDLVANAYEEHERIYRSCETANGPRHVVVRGRGIVASRIIQRLAEARAANPDIRVLHSVRSPRAPRDGATWNQARRPVRGNVEIQPFNWPKACWTGELRQDHEDGGVDLRSDMQRTLGGTTTAERGDWREIIERGTEEGWYRPVYGGVQSIAPRRAHDGRKGVQVEVETPEGHCETLNADFLIDCTGLVGEVTRSPLLADLIKHYRLPRNAIAPDGKTAGLHVTDCFEVDAIRNGGGSAWASGTITSGGPYLAVDSFLGLQYAAFRATQALAAQADSPVRRLRAGRSLAQWVRWCTNRTPC